MKTYRYFIKRLMSLERKYERAKGDIERARIRKGVRNTIKRMQKLGYDIPKEFA